ncbi:MAG: replicative DNA helicase [Candidatus Eisenbacteria bacterium]|nr:replicative DNA helicase [Candidatus Eisenbacteria bacterium]
MTVTTQPAGLIPPQNLEAERAVLGAMLLNRQALLIGMEQLRPRDFYRPEHAKIFSAAVNLFNHDSAVDLVTVSDELRRMDALEQVGGEAAVAAVCDSVASIGNMEHYCRIVKDRSLMRLMIESCSQVVSECFQASEPARDILTRAQGSIFELSQASGRRTFVAVRDMLQATLHTIEDFHLHKVHVTGVPTGFPDLDNLTAGFQKGDLVIVAGRPSMGKTALALNMAEHVAIDPNGPRRPVGIFSLEMSTESLVLRLLCSHARVNSHRMRTGYLKKEEWRDLVMKADALDSARIFIDDSGSSNIMEIRAKARRLKMEHPDLAMLVVDYLQLISGMPGTESRQQEITQISRSLKALAKELELPVLALSQLSRAVETRGGTGKPVLSDLRECVTGGTLVGLADGRRVPIRTLVGEKPEVLAMSPEGRVIRATSDKVWAVGRRPVFDVALASGRTVCATGRHRLYGANGWVRVDGMAEGERLGIGSEGAGTISITDPILSITPAGEDEVFDLTVPGPSSWLANGIVSHNSGAIEQDADVVMFVYRPGYYKTSADKTAEEMAKAEIILAKQRNGPTGSVPLVFLSECTRFETSVRKGDEEFA